VYMFHLLRSRGSRVGSRAFAMALNRMLLFTLAFIFTWAWPLIFQITALDKASGDDDAGGGDGDGGDGGGNVIGSSENAPTFVRWDSERFAWMVFTQAFFLASHGTVNALIWITPLTRMRRQALARAIMRRISSFTRFSRRFGSRSSRYSEESRASPGRRSPSRSGEHAAARLVVQQTAALPKVEEEVDGDEDDLIGQRSRAATAVSQV